MIHYKIFESIDDQLIAEIDRIKTLSFSYVFQQSEWIRTFVPFKKNLIKFKIVFIYKNQEIILVAPMCIKSRYGCKELGWLSSDIIDYNGLIISKTFNFKDILFIDLWKKIINSLSKECDLIFFNKIPELIKSINNPIINSQYKFYQNSYQLNLNDFEYNNFYNNKNNSKSKETDRRKKKKLVNGDDLVCSYMEINLSNFKFVEELIFEKMSSYISKKEKTFNHKYLANLYREIVSCNSNNFKFNLSILKKKSIKISSIFGVIFNGIYYYLIPVTHNTEYKKLSPGRFHITNLINWSIKNNMQQIDFTPGDETYKINWSNNDFKIFYYIKPLSLKGIARYLFLNFYYKFRKNNFLKKIYHYIHYEI
jgi:CelD/BcsL family acetyltransferase involved in cellulose biosynthesis